MQNYANFDEMNHFVGNNLFHVLFSFKFCAILHWHDFDFVQHFLITQKNENFKNNVLIKT